MREEAVALLRCPDCRSEELGLEPYERDGANVVEGVLRCARCGSWYRIEGEIADLRPVAARRETVTRAFAERHGLPHTASPAAHTGHDHDGHFERYVDEYERRVVSSPYHAIHDDVWFLPWVARALRAGDLALEVGCGTGRQTLQLAERGLRTLSLDPSEVMVQRARDKLRARGLWANTDFVLGVAESLPVRGGRFAACVIHGTLHHVEEPRAALAEAAAALRRGGRLYIVDNHRSPVRFLFDLLMRARPLYEEEEHADALFTGDDLTGWLATAGVRGRTALSTFLPPHLWYLVRGRAGRALLRLTDGVFGRIPFIRRFAGIVIVEGERTV